VSPLDGREATGGNVFGSEGMKLVQSQWGKGVCVATGGGLETSSQREGIISALDFGTSRGPRSILKEEACLFFLRRESQFVQEEKGRGRSKKKGLTSQYLHPSTIPSFLPQLTETGPTKKRGKW